MGTNVPFLHSTAHHALYCEIIEWLPMTKVQVAEIKKVCHFSSHPTARINTGVPAKSGYIYIFLLLCIYIEVLFRGCIYFSVSQPSIISSVFLFFKLALATWKKDIYPATFRCTLASMRSPAWLHKWQTFLISAIGTSLNPIYSIISCTNPTLHSPRTPFIKDY